MAVDFRELAPITREVVIGDTAIEVRGISMRNFAKVTLDHPELLTWLAGAKADPVALLTTLPDAAVAMMAGGLGKPDDEEVEAVLDNWAFAQQAELLTAVLDLTLGGEKALPFVQMLLAAAVQAAGAGSQDPLGEAQPNPSISASGSPSSPPS